MLQYTECEQVCVAERIAEEKRRLEEAYDMIRVKATARIQAWWRGTIVRL